MGTGWHHQGDIVSVSAGRHATHFPIRCRKTKILDKRLLSGLSMVGLLILGGCVALVWRPGIEPVPPPTADSFSPAAVVRGQMLAGAGNCAVCHTSDPVHPYAGGVGFASSFGTIYSTNITPDAATGIGHWSLAAFTRAMHEGLARDGSHLFPAFPYDHFTKVSDGDLEALYAFLMTLTPVIAPDRKNDLPFPMNIRALQAGWKLLYFRPGRYAADTTKSPDWNRGAYLGEGLAHCSACHSPRNALGAEDPRQAYGGAVIDGWIAPALTDANPSPLIWSEPELFTYLRGGVTVLHGSAVGPMSSVVHGGLSALPDEDIHSIAVYYADLGRRTAPGGGKTAIRSRALVASMPGIGQTNDVDARLYVAACAACHYSSSADPSAQRPDLALNSALRLDQPTNLIQVVLHGVGVAEGDPSLMMPGFAAALSDADIARLIVYLRRTQTGLPPWADVEPQVAAIRKARGDAP